MQANLCFERQLDESLFLPRALSATLVQENTPVKSLERTLQEQDIELRELRKRVGKTGASTNLAQELSESGLPDAAQARVRKLLPASAGKDAIKQAIAQEREYVRKVRTGARAQNQGERASRLAESYKLMGLSEKEANLAAGVEVSVSNISEARQKLANAAKLLGMTDAEASVFSQI
jgi:hypothetical protein